MLPIGGTLVLTALDVISWESSDPKIAAIVPTSEHTAVVIGLAPGTTTIKMNGAQGSGSAVITVTGEVALVVQAARVREPAETAR